MSPLLICLIITVCIVIIWGFLDAPNEIASTIMNWLSKGKIKRVELKKPFGCTLCMTFWTTLIVLLILAPEWCFMSLVYAISTKYILYIIELMDKALVKLFTKIDELL